MPKKKIVSEVFNFFGNETKTNKENNFKHKKIFRFGFGWFCDKFKSWFLTVAIFSHFLNIFKSVSESFENVGNKLKKTAEDYFKHKKKYNLGFRWFWCQFFKFFESQKKEKSENQICDCGRSKNICVSLKFFKWMRQCRGLARPLLWKRQKIENPQIDPKQK